jgi:predicted amidohydrolase YtcJ
MTRTALSGALDRTVDLGGRTLMPGMFTCHFHATYHELGSRRTRPTATSTRRRTWR